MIAWIWLVFLLGVGALALAVFPHWRPSLSGRRSRQRARARRTGSTGLTRRTSRPGVAWGRQKRRQAGGGKPVTNGAGWPLISALFIGSSLGLTWWWAFYQGEIWMVLMIASSQAIIKSVQLLKGEHLVPPPPLPPDVLRPLKPNRVRPMFRPPTAVGIRWTTSVCSALVDGIKIMREEHGYDMALLEGYRSPERQNMLAAKGGHVTRPRRGKAITSMAGG